MSLYSTNNTDVLLKTSLESNIGIISETKASNADTTSKGLIGILKGLWQTLLDRLPTLSSGAIPVSINGIGAATTITKTIVAVTTSSQILLASNSNRVGFLIVNRYTNTEISYIDFAATATATSGLEVPPGYERNQDYLYTGTISVIGTGNHNITVWEFVKWLR